MKLEALKKAIKEVVKEVIQEELKEILLEAVKGTKIVQPQTMVESTIPQQPQTPIMNSQPQMSHQQQREAYKNILGETSAQFTSQQAQSFVPKPGMDTANGELPKGEVDMNQIMGLMNSK
jgi:NADH:ubiquinone oxidoreductase subunit D